MGSHTVLDPRQKELLNLAAQRGQSVNRRTLADSIASINPPAFGHLASYAVLGMNLVFVEIEQFFESGGFLLQGEELINWLVQCLEWDLIRIEYPDGHDEPYFSCPDGVRHYFLTHLSSDELALEHRRAISFHSEKLALLASDIGFVLRGGEKAIEPGGFLDQISHLPQYQSLHHNILNYALNWHEHLFQLREFEDAANILNSICFALSRRGQKKLAESLLARIATQTKGLISLAAWINLATLLRQEQQHSAALRIYWRTVPGLLRLRAFIQLAQVLTEISAVYRQTGKLIPSALMLEFSVILNGRLKNGQSQAIAQSQLASTYRLLRMYQPALKVSTAAISYFRLADDRLNLGRSLLTQGNIYYNLKMIELAFTCFDEAQQVGRQIGDPQAEIGALGGKARLLMLTGFLDQAKQLLEETISRREQIRDHTVGVEYQNLGVCYEQQGNLALALGWYQKAQLEFERYLPVEAPSCRRKIAALEKKLAKRR